MLIEPVNGSGKQVAPLARPELLHEVKVGVSGDGDASSTSAAIEKPDLAELAEIAVDVQTNLNMMHDVALNFSVHESSGRVVVTVADEETGEIIREIPSGEFLNLSVKLEEMFGMLFDQKA